MKVPEGLSNRGFSIVGVLIAVVILGFLATLIVVFLQQQEFFKKQVLTKDAVQEVKDGIKLAMGKRIRNIMISGNPSAIRNKSIPIGNNLSLRFTRRVKIPKGKGLQAPSKEMKKFAKMCKEPKFNKVAIWFCMQINKKGKKPSIRKGGSSFYDFEYAFVAFGAKAEHAAGMQNTLTELKQTGSATMVEVQMFTLWTYRTPKTSKRISHEDMSTFFIAPR